MTDKRLYLAVAACAIVVHLGALWNRYAVDDVYIVALNPVVQQPATFWRAFFQPYWPGNAFSLGRNRLADSLLVQADRVCQPCAGSYRGQAEAARQRGAQAAADSLEARARKLEAP